MCRRAIWKQYFMKGLQKTHQLAVVKKSKQANSYYNEYLHELS